MMNQWSNKFYFFVLGLFFLLGQHETEAQITLVPYRHSISTFQNSRLAPVRANARTAATVVDTLALPFFEDFSQNTPEDFDPDTNLWMPNSGVMINNNFAINPPTANCATFDGLNQFLVPYSSFRFGYGVTDSLVSKPINLKTVKLNSNLRISFFYESGGYAEMPEYSEGDSLVLKLRYSFIPDSLGFKYKKDTISVGWKTVWSRFATRGNPVKLADTSSFYFVNIAIHDTIFYHSGFQFKFLVHGKESGVFDSWHLDYVYLDTNRFATINDKLLSDRALIEFVKKPLKYYTAVPYNHFNVNRVAFLSDSLSFSGSNLSTGSNGLSGSLIVKDLLATSRDSVRFEDDNIMAPGEIGYNRQIPISSSWYLDNVDKEQKILTRFRIPFNVDSANGESLGIDLGSNNKVDCITHLDDYYAYDDGVPEYSASMDYINSKMLTRFVFPVKDTITAVDISFSQNVRSTSGEKFKICIYKKITFGNSKYDSLIYRSSDYDVRYNMVHTDTIADGFVRYPLGISTVANAILKDTVYIGFEQNSQSKIEVSYDRDEQSSGVDATFSYVTDWLPLIGIKGHLLIRPVFGTYSTPQTEIGHSTGVPTDYPGGPNPAGNTYTLFGVHPSSATIASVAGSSQNIVPFINGDNTDFDLSALNSGVYILQYVVNGSTLSKKIIKI